MTLVLLIAAVWLLGLTGLVAICRSAARGDLAMRGRRDFGGGHEFPLAG